MASGDAEMTATWVCPSPPAFAAGRTERRIARRAPRAQASPVTRAAGPSSGSATPASVAARRPSAVGPQVTCPRPAYMAPARGAATPGTRKAVVQVAIKVPVVGRAPPTPRVPRVKALDLTAARQLPAPPSARAAVRAAGVVPAPSGSAPIPSPTGP